ncbi:MAG: hypothetical protein R3F60_31795 [bacterium]
MRSTLILCLILAPGLAVARPDPGPFARGKTRFSLGGGTSGQFGQRYITIGMGVGYYAAHGLEVGLDGQVFFGAEPAIFTVSPQLRYVFWQADPIQPYIGGFFRHQFIGDVDGQAIDDVDSVGARGGLFWISGRTYVGIGVAYEQILNCDKAVFESCDEIYPELALAISL